MNAIAPETGMLKKIMRYVRRRFLDAPRGYGHPVPAVVFDREYRSGHWHLLDSIDEQIRYDTLVRLIRGDHSRPRLLDAGCGSGRLAACFDSAELAAYHGVDLSAEAIFHARRRAPAGSILQQLDLETWTPVDQYDVIVINEVVGYFRDPLLTLRKLADSLLPNGVLIVSLYRWGNAAAIWRRLDTGFQTLHAAVASNINGDKTWDIRILVPHRQAATKPNSTL